MRGAEWAAFLRGSWEGAGAQTPPWASRGRGGLPCESLAGGRLGAPRVGALGRSQPLRHLPPAARSWGRGCASSLREGGTWGAGVDRFLCFGKISAAPECYLNSSCSSVPSRSGEKLETRRDAGSDTAGAAGTAGTGSRRAPGRGADGSAAAGQGPGVGHQGRPPGRRAPAGAGRGSGPAPRLELPPPGEKAGHPARRSPRAVRGDSVQGPSGRAHRPGSGRPVLRAPRVLRQNCFTAPKCVCPRLRGLGCGWLPALAWAPVLPRRGRGPPRPRAQRCGLESRFGCTSNGPAQGKR